MCSRSQNDLAMLSPHTRRQDECCSDGANPSAATCSGDLETAAGDLREAERTDPSHPEIATLEAALEKARAARTGPQIDRILALLAAGRIDEAKSA